MFFYFYPRIKPSSTDFGFEPFFVVHFIYSELTHWNNHHHLPHMVRTMNGPLMWLNLLHLFWLSLVPFTTAWMGKAILRHTNCAVRFYTTARSIVVLVASAGDCKPAF
ncbi:MULTISPECIES: TMEM175 family protein, partial [Paenibacillus]